MFLKEKTHDFLTKNGLIKVGLMSIEELNKEGQPLVEFFILKLTSPFRVAAAQCKTICPERLN